ncbi:MAG: Hemerythrin HHE cation binding domain protein [Parcubacteria group bacterium GW2011_GWF2_43_11]|nr:MAG: Hemerythrin HHE cation binding domain protein [Parcubacteria group bacterium GW2011_GWF2_43_11]
MELNLKPGHIIHTMTEEHKMILGFLDELEKTNQRIQEEGKYSGDNGDFEKLENIAEHLVGAEPHYQREEEVLFPEIEKRGVSCPPEVMRKEHEELRPKKKEILELCRSVSKMDFQNFKKKLKEAADFLIPMLREHIAKENDILYPLSLEVIPEEVVWQEMKKECDEIGYCCFTPKV